ncbi:MAG TPA: methylated-DNA--[protein]-cysteine S-methyltransferase [bacterium]|nr:methylated-DNA--[protein]-cysteine S-methyltransferase [bacterium]
MKPQDYDRVEKTIRYLSRHFSENPPLGKLAREAGLSPFHFQRLFKRWAGVSPKQFIQYLSAQNAKQRLLQSKSLLDAAFDAGLSSPGRLHDLLVSVEAMTPGDYRRRGRDLVLEYGTCDSPFGRCLLLFTPRGLSGLAFLRGKDFGPELRDFKRRWPLSIFKLNPARAARMGRSLFRRKKAGAGKIHLVLKGTSFQLKVWEALLRLPGRALVSYGRLAREVGRAGASRAVGTAVGQNPVAYLIPCHRVIRESGVLGGYHWGVERKKALLGWEAAQK